MEELLPPLEEGFSADGYIINQDCFSSVRYRTMRGDYNSCGWIAAYNLRHFLGQTDEWDAVRCEMDEMHTLRFPGPTLMRVMRGYLDRYVPGWAETGGREAAIEAADGSRACIFRYSEEHVPHFIFCCRVQDDIFRFFNVNDDLWDFTMALGQFAEGHFVQGNVIALTV